VSEPFVNTGFDADADGSAQIIVKHKGAAEVERLRLVLSHLDARSTYRLLASVGDETNLVVVSEFTTTPSGRALVLGLNPGKKRTIAKRRKLAAELIPLVEVTKLAVANSNGDIVLTVDLRSSPSLNFQLSSVLTSTGVDPTAVGCVAVAIQDGNTQFRLFAAGASSSFTVLVNESPIGIYPAGPGGRISLGALPPSAPSPLSFKSFSILNADTDEILTTTVP
jgi:hypothetical protein